MPPAPANSSTTFRVAAASRRLPFTSGPHPEVSSSLLRTRASCLRATVMFARPLIVDAVPEGFPPLAGSASRLARRAATRIQRPCAISCTNSAVGPLKDEMPMMVPLCTPLIPPICAAKRFPVPPGRSTAPSRAARYETAVPSGVHTVTADQVPRSSNSAARRPAPPRMIGVTHSLGRISTTNESSRSRRAARNGLLEPKDVPATTTVFAPAEGASLSKSRTMSSRARRLDRISSAS